MRLSIAYAKNFKHNLSWYIEAKQEAENEKRQQKKLIDEQNAAKEAEERRKALYLDVEPEPPFTSKLPFSYKRPEKTLKTHPDLTEDIQRTASEITSQKNHLLSILNPEQNSLADVQNRLNDLESKIREQDLRRFPTQP